MTHQQVFGQKFTPIRMFLAWKSHPFWPHIPNMTQYGSAPPGEDDGMDTQLTVTVLLPHIAKGGFCMRGHRSLCLSPDLA